MPEYRSKLLEYQFLKTDIGSIHHSPVSSEKSIKIKTMIKLVVAILN